MAPERVAGTWSLMRSAGRLFEGTVRTSHAVEAHTSMSSLLVRMPPDHAVGT
jgi:hypothetical protein